MDGSRGDNFIGILWLRTMGYSFPLVSRICLKDKNELDRHFSAIVKRKYLLKRVKVGDRMGY